MKKQMGLLVAMMALAACSASHDQQTATVNAPESAVVGGQEIEVGSPLAKSTVGIYGSDVGYICSGTLIAKNIVLTAAHCVDEKEKNLKIYFTNKMKGADDAVKRPVVAAVVNANYSKEVRAEDMADVAVLKFEGEIPGDYTIANMLTDSSELYDGRQIFVAGFGLNWTIGVSRGAGTLRATALEIDDAKYSATEVKLGQSLRRGICSGDSGGPAYLLKDGQLYIWGVASRGDALPVPLVPKCMMFSVYTRVDAYSSWIQDAINQLNK
jgi:secreted trypsin-like serine protease